MRGWGGHGPGDARCCLHRFMFFCKISLNIKKKKKKGEIKEQTNNAKSKKRLAPPRGSGPTGHEQSYANVLDKLGEKEKLPKDTNS